MIPTEILCSAAVGFAISVLLINFGSQTAPLTQSDANNTSESTLPDESATTHRESELQPTVYLDEDTVIKRSKFLQESLGLSSESIKEAVRQTNEELRREPATADVNIMQDTSLNILSVVLDYLVFGVVLAVCFYSANTLMKGDLLKMFTALFRTELESIKLSKLPIFIKQYFNIQEDL